MTVLEKSPRRYNKRLAMAAITGVLLVGAAAVLVHFSDQPLQPSALGTRVPLFLLWCLDVTLIAATLFVIFRALIKLALERRRGVLGAKFRTKLLVTCLGLAAVPIALLFLVATNLLQRSIEHWFSTPVSTIVNRSEQLRDLADQRVWEAAAREASALARQINAGALPAELFSRDLRLRNFASLEYYPGRGDPVRVSAANTPLPPLYPADQLALARQEKTSQSLDVLPGGGGWFRSAARGRDGVIVAGLRVSAEQSSAGDFIARAWSDYHMTEVQKPALQASSLLLFTLLTLGLLFAAIWMGLQLARRITAPIEALAQSTERIAQGDFSTEVDVAATDELGVLVESFNKMTGEIRDNRARLEQSNRDLTTINQRLDRERQLLSAILQNAHTGIIALSSEGSIRLANPAVLEILGLSTLPASIAGLSGREDLAPLCEMVRLARDGVASPPRELSPGGPESPRRAEISISPMTGTDGRTDGYVLVLEDTTEVVRAQKLQAWTEVARRVAHEIKNPLTPIKLSAERMMKKVNANDPTAGQATREGARVIIEEVNLLKSLVDQFSRFAKMPGPRPTPTDLPALARQTIALYQNAREGVRIELQNDLPRQTYRLDGEQFQRALANLLDNALEASEPGGSVTLSLAETNGTLAIAVADTGRGVGPADRERIFLPDFSTKPGNSGLGLAIVSRIVADHHGTIRCEDNPPHGAKFVIELPAA